MKQLVSFLSAFNDIVLAIGRNIAWVAMAVMVLVILLQVFMRYVLNNALPWPEEAARALMIWMMALVAPSAYRWGGFVSIDMVLEAMPDLLRRILTISILVLAGIVLYVLLTHAIKHFQGGFLFKSSGLKIPLAWIYLAMSVCFGLMLSVNIELLLRTLGRMFGNADDYPRPQMPKILGAAE